MNKRVKYALVFTGGMCLGAGIVGVNILKNDDFLQCIKHKVSDKFDKLLFGDEKYTHDRLKPVSYRQQYYNRYSKYDSDIIELNCDSLAECNRIKDEMKDLINSYGFVTVGDLYNIANLNDIHHSYDYFNRGWVDINSIEIISLKDCYVLKLPNPLFIN